MKLNRNYIHQHPSLRFDNHLWVYVEVYDSPNAFMWRLGCGSQVSVWFSYYQGILTHVFFGRTFAVATEYWTGTFPTMTPFEIKRGESLPPNYPK